MVIFLSFAWPRHWKFFSLSLVAYALLMMHLGYHTAMDILTTGFTVGLLVTAWLKLLRHPNPQDAGYRVAQPHRP